MNNSKDKQLEQFRVNDLNTALTTNQGLKMSEDEFSLKAGERGPTLMEDFHFREKITHFDHERIPERAVHARGTGAYGEFELYESMSQYTKASFLQNPAVKTPVFVRFSTVAGSRGSADTVRDVRGFAIKFYTQEGNYDLVGNNMPVFFIQDAIKFPDFIHAVKPEPNTEVPQASSAHDTFWDFVSANQESAHMVMWAMSDRALPRSYRMMEGFGVHTFRFINQDGKSIFVKFHLKPVLGVHSLVWDETQKLAGKDPDFNRKDLQQAIAAGNFPEYEFGVQLLEEKDEFNLDFDILDATKIWPEEDIPVKIIGKLTLNRNVDNFFAEVEQAAFHPGHLVPGIDFTNDPLLQGRLFSYTDTQLSRLGGPNFHELPVNKPIVQPHNNQRDGMHRQTINMGNVSYHNNSLADNTPTTVNKGQGGYEHYQETIHGNKVKARSDSFKDHFSQAAMFYNSMSAVEKQHIIDAFKFELSKVNCKEIRQNVINMFAHVSTDLVTQVAAHIGAAVPATIEQSAYKKTSPALSMANTIKKAATAKVGIIISAGFDAKAVAAIVKKLQDAKAIPEIIAPSLTPVKSADGAVQQPLHSLMSTDPVVFDGLYIATGDTSCNQFAADVKKFIKETYVHYKSIGFAQSAISLLPATIQSQPGITTEQQAENTDQFVQDVATRRHWGRDITLM